MSERKINLEEILSKRIVLEPSHIRKEILIAMKEACRQTLELAAENAIIFLPSHSHLHGTKNIDKQSILNTINQIE